MGFLNTGAFADAISGGKSILASFAKTTASGSAWTAGYWYDMSMCTGSPKLNVYPGNLLEATKLDYKSPGNIWHGPLQTPATKHITDVHVETFASTVAPCTLILCDYVLFYPMIDCDYDGEQDMDNTPRSISRYNTPAAKAGLGLQAFVVATSALGAGTSNWYISYTNSAGVSGRALSWSPLNIASAVAGQLLHAPAQCCSPFLPLQAGDIGIRSVEWVQLSAGTGGGYAAIVLCRPLLTIPLVTQSVASERSFIRDLFTLPQVQDAAFLNFLILPGAAVPNASAIRGRVELAWGP